MGGQTIARSTALGGCLTALLIAWVAVAPAAHAAGAVTANPDNVHTTVNTAKDFDPTANDTIAQGATFTFVEIESDPSHGTATVNADKRTIHYVPDPGYTGPDSMEYNIHVCVPFDSVVRAGAPCDDREDTGDVAITVDPAATTTTVTLAPLGTTVPTTTAASSSTTVAAAAKGLPNTGSTSGPFAVFAVFAVAGGAMLIASARRRARARG